MRKESAAKYDRITHAQRIHAIYLKTIHGMKMEDIEAVTGVKYNSIRNIMRTYRRYGMTNKKLILCPRQIQKKPTQTQHSRSSRRPVRRPAQAQGFQSQARASVARFLSADSDPREISPASSSAQMMVLDVQNNIYCGTKTASRGTHGSKWCTLKLLLEPAARSGDSDEFSTKLCTPEDFADYGQTDNVELMPSDLSSFENSRSSRLQVFTGPLKCLNKTSRIGEERNLLCPWQR